MAVELAAFGSTVNCVSPGMVKTELLEHFPVRLVEATAAQNPLRRLATPEEVANVVGFLASSKAGYLNGVNLTVNGGSVML
jgi:NAD(P)-dependent dehydrogenase (short-subunit alcohol dehydrogenase family)